MAEMPECSHGQPLDTECTACSDELGARRLNADTVREQQAHIRDLEHRLAQLTRVTPGTMPITIEVPLDMSAPLIVRGLRSMAEELGCKFSSTLVAGRAVYTFTRRAQRVTPLRRSPEPPTAA